MLEMDVGPMLHRSYAVRITGSNMTAAALVDLVAERLNQVSPEMAVFRKTRGTASALRLGDEFLVRMPGLRDVSEGDALPGWVLAGAPPHPQGGQGEGAEEYDDSDDQQVQQAFGDHADDAQRDRCDY
jgi:hypothetical protein